MAKADRRKARDAAVLEFNGLAEEAGLEKVDYRPGPEAVANLYGRLCAAGLPPPSLEREAASDSSVNRQRANPQWSQHCARGKDAPPIILNIALLTLTPVFILVL